MAAKKNNYGYTELMRDIKADNAARMYMFYGDEPYLREHALRVLKERLVSDDMADFNFELIDRKGVTIYDIAEAVDPLPVMADRRLVIVNDYPAADPPAAERAAAAEFFSGLPDHICLVFNYDTLKYKRDGKNRTLAAALECGTAVEFKKIGGAELIRWIRRRFASWGKDIDDATCEYLMFYCGTMMTALSSETDKIAAFAKGVNITKADIEAVAAKTLDTAVYELTDELTAGHGAAAVRRLRELQFLGFDQMVLSASICRQMMRLYSARLCIEQGRGAAYLAKLWDMRSSYPAEKLISASRRMELGRLRRALDICADCDEELKSMPGDKNVMLETAVLRLAALTGGGAR